MNKVYKRVYQEHNVHELSPDIDNSTESRTYIVS